jgi:hypothetical protein
LCRSADDRSEFIAGGVNVVRRNNTVGSIRSTVASGVVGVADSGGVLGVAGEAVEVVVAEALVQRGVRLSLMPVMRPALS